MAKIAEYYRKQVARLKAKECAYNDPTLDYNKPYYMTKRVLDKYNKSNNDQNNKQT